MSNATVPATATASSFSPDQLAVLEGLDTINGNVTTAPPRTNFPVSMKKITVYHLSPAQQAAWPIVAAAMTLPGRGADIDPGTWQSWMLSVVLLYYPELREQFQSDDKMTGYTFATYPAAFVDELAAAFNAQKDEETMGDKTVEFPVELPATAVPINQELAAAISQETLYSWFAMVVYIMNKAANTTNTSAFTSRRPQALLKMMGNPQAEYFLIGDGKIDPANYDKIRTAMVRSIRPRLHIIMHLAALVSGQCDEIHAPVVANFNLLKQANQSYMVFINQLVMTYPWIIDEMPTVRNEFRHFVNMGRVLLAQPEYLRPYYKLMMLNSDVQVSRKNVPALIAIAAVVAAQSASTMKNYRVDQSAQHHVQQFIAIALRKGQTIVPVKDQATTDVNVV